MDLKIKESLYFFSTARNMQRQLQPAAVISMKLLVYYFNNSVERSELYCTVCLCTNIYKFNTNT